MTERKALPSHHQMSKVYAVLTLRRKSQGPVGKQCLGHHGTWGRRSARAGPLLSLSGHLQDGWLGPGSERLCWRARCPQSPMHMGGAWERPCHCRTNCFGAPAIGSDEARKPGFCVTPPLGSMGNRAQDSVSCGGEGRGRCLSSCICF